MSGDEAMGEPEVESTPAPKRPLSAGPRMVIVEPLPAPKRPRSAGLPWPDQLLEPLPPLKRSRSAPPAPTRVEEDEPPPILTRSFSAPPGPTTKRDILFWAYYKLEKKRRARWE